MRLWKIYDRLLREKHRRLARKVAKIYPTIERIEHWYGTKLYINGQLWRPKT